MLGAERNSRPWLAAGVDEAGGGGGRVAGLLEDEEIEVEGESD